MSPGRYHLIETFSLTLVSVCRPLAALLRRRLRHLAAALLLLQLLRRLGHPPHLQQPPTSLLRFPTVDRTSEDSSLPACRASKRLTRTATTRPGPISVACSPAACRRSRSRAAVAATTRRLLRLGLHPRGLRHLRALHRVHPLPRPRPRGLPRRLLRRPPVLRLLLRPPLLLRPSPPVCRTAARILAVSLQRAYPSSSRAAAVVAEAMIRRHLRRGLRRLERLRLALLPDHLRLPARHLGRLHLQLSRRRLWLRLCQTAGRTWVACSPPACPSSSRLAPQRAHRSAMQRRLQLPRAGARRV